MSDTTASVAFVALAELHQAPWNPRTIDAEEIATLKASIKADPTFMLLQPLLARPGGEVYSGNQRLTALEQLYAEGWQPIAWPFATAPTIWSDIDDRLAMERGIRANTHQGRWRDEQVGALIQDLRARGTSIPTLGFDDKYVERILAAMQQTPPEADDGADTAAAGLPAIAVTRAGDLWQLGAHRLVCGDSMDAKAVTRLMDGRRADLLFTSPPYNVNVPYSDHDDTVQAWPIYAQFLGGVLRQWLNRLAPGRFVGWNVSTNPKTYHARQHVLLEDLGLTYFRQIIWRKVGVPLPTWHNTRVDPRARHFTPNLTHEVIMLFTKGPPELGAMGALDPLCENDVFELAQNTATHDLPSGPTRSGLPSNLKRRSFKAHPAAYPVRLPKMFATHLTAPGELLIDPFLGSGSSMIAAEELGRHCYGMDMDPVYCDVALERWARLTGGDPRRHDGAQWGDLKAEARRRAAAEGINDQAE